jgi:hypothetical protein
VATIDATKLMVQLVPGYRKLDQAKGAMVPTYPPAHPRPSGSSPAPLAPIVSLASALQDSFEGDEPNFRWFRDGRCYIMQCEPRPLRRNATQGPRLAGKAWADSPVTMVLLLTDIDASGKKEPGFDSLQWWHDQERARARFLIAHPGAFFASSRGGLRIYQALEKPFIIDSQAKADEWKLRYVTWCAQVGAFGWKNAAHGGADETKDWTRLQRIPHDTRDGVLQLLPTEGDPRRVGTVDLPEPASAPKPRTALRPYTGPMRAAKVKRWVLERVAAVLPRQGDGVHDAAFALGGLMSAAEWSTDDCTQFVTHCFAIAGIQREDIARTAELSVATARAGGKTYGWRRLIELCTGDRAAIELACGAMRANIPGLGRDSQFQDAIASEGKARGD